MVFRLAFVLLFACCVSQAEAAGERILKVLHHLVDSEGRNALAPSLFERDAYQAYLREHPELVAGSQFDVQLKAPRKSGEVLLRIEVRTSKGGLGKSQQFETTVLPDRWGSTWGRIKLDKAASEALGTIIAWRATLWRDGFLIADQESFLW